MIYERRKLHISIEKRVVNKDYVVLTHLIYRLQDCLRAINISRERCNTVLHHDSVKYNDRVKYSVSWNT